MPTLSGYRKVTLPGSYFARIDKGHFVRNLRQSDEIYKKCTKLIIFLQSFSMKNGKKDILCFPKYGRLSLVMMVVRGGGV